ncbi:hypothetical protein [Streptomyces sp. NPDC007100]|uniref:hypothetical protein n=1 Tax=Streptomyces sp. NPDC007100 TaxID=3155602 RepID=UPI0033F6BDB3
MSGLGPPRKFYALNDAGFCAALAGEEGARNHRDRWREQLNRNVAKKLSRLGG